MCQTTFSTTTTSAKRAATVSIRGAVDLASAPGMRDAIRACLHEGSLRISLDMDEVTFIDCSGVGAIIECRSEAGVTGSALSLIRPSRSVLRFMTLTHTDDLLDPVSP